MIDLNELRQGESLGSGYTFERSVRRDAEGAFFAVLSEDGERLLMKLVAAGDPEAERQFATWQWGRDLHHPHLLDVRDAGRLELAGNNCMYAIFEYPDDVLASALEQGPLSEPETRTVLKAALGALRYLHDRRLVHGAVDAGHVVAVGETVKLATDALCESEDPERQAEDVRQLGELVRSLRAPLPLGGPLAAIVQRATAAEAAQRWTLTEIEAALESPPPPVPVIPAAEAPAAVETDARPRSFPRWILAGLAILLLLILVLNMRRKPSNLPHAAAVVPSGNGPIATPSLNTPLPAPLAAPGKWRVIAFTYRSRDMAEKKARQINKRWPDLHAGIFTPKESRGYFLVALGEAMQREDAAVLQHKARSLGLPRDTYLQNYAE